MKKLLTLFLTLHLLLGILVSCADPVDPLPDETTTAAAGGDVTTADSKGSETSGKTPWYLSAKEQDFETVPVPDALSGYVLQVPALTEETVGDLHFKVELFRETWDIGGRMQCRLTVKNQGEEDLRYWSNAPRCVMFRCGEKTSSDNIGLSDDVPSFDIDAIERATIAPGESYVVEMASLVDPDIFLSGDPVTIVVTLYKADGGVDGFASYGSVTIPVTLVKTDP